MFTRPVFETADIDEQGKLLDAVADLADAGKIRSTLTEVMRPISATNLKQAHALLESNRMRGKLVLEGWPD